MPVKLNGATSGSVTIDAPAVAGTTTLTLPATTGTFNTSGSVNEVPAGSVSAPSIYSTGDTNTGIFFPAADTIAFAEGGVEAMRINSSGNVQIYNLGLGNTTPSTSGTGITFPATQSASTNANTLDDYEEGTWSAVVAGESGTITTYSINTTYYTKIGNIVNAFVRFGVTNLGTGSNFVVSGLPFAAAAELLGIWSETNTTGLTGFMFTTVAPGATSFTSRLASSWGGQCLVNGTYTVQVTYKVQ